MNSGQYDLLTKIIRGEIPTINITNASKGEIAICQKSGLLYAAIKAMYKENIRLSLKVVELGGPEMKSEFWQYEDETTRSMRAIASKDGINYVSNSVEDMKREGKDL